VAGGNRFDVSKTPPEAATRAIGMVGERQWWSIMFSPKGLQNQESLPGTIRCVKYTKCRCRFWTTSLHLHSGRL
jgi:hypothetical protein